ncbi:cytochrome c oxidase subunit II [Clavibacter zhangzhiyongii]|uniref:Cytochrome aa3 subunit 2 n=1 Tax=Clavibacter zhangzhiyongii TaxID=2768071 RepID=A0A7L7YZE2_9MICO|nr:cytochrome c oxidase subunit II [Clavibacter zhangzhiyongii]MBM7024550.1 cytochrome c oxidase subunit II [Clavibacter zhangzhiyongii]QOD42824.1 cytochrome c oxidase subunit II [Clavibacter zhangzhiyongii]
MRSTRRQRWLTIPVAIGISVLLAGCTQQQLQGFLPTEAGTTNHVDSVIGLWVTAWIVLLAVGVLTWGLTIWAAVVYRRRKGQTGLPVQMRYNMPIEIFYTIVPLILVLGFFAFTAKDQAAIEARFDQPEVKVQVFGKQWAWDFNYLGGETESGQAIEGGAYEQGVQAVDDPDGPQGSIDKDKLPTLYLPVNTKVELELNTRDTLHSFWVVDFLYKKDLISGKTNYMTFIPEKEGTYMGKCAELCGEYHSLMLFQVKVVSIDEYNAYIESQKAAGFEGDLGKDYDRLQNLPGTDVPATTESSEE